MNALKEQISTRVARYDLWAQRRRYGPDGHNNRSLWVLACMDERPPVDEALGIHVEILRLVVGMSTVSVMQEESSPTMQFVRRC